MITVYVMTLLLMFTDGHKAIFQVERTKEACAVAMRQQLNALSDHHAVVTGSCIPRQIAPNGMIDFGYGVLSHWTFGEPIMSEKRMGTGT